MKGERFFKFGHTGHVSSYFQVLAQWVRRAFREAWQARSTRDTHARLKAVRRAAEYSFPTGNIDQMLAGIEHGYHE